ncbi:lysM domain receptor-like kinase 4 [Heracleum sosnowskyi]|uniref:LysM domain receptor-like kinase 4 n=1 Tax=Heracleum sosnowskyi TaxID=360622 RepID=A0AAD8IDC5_9APIA|nr:lysM domain receptor-like kinase 4 [Heracleum sosnowskyi]
MDYDYVHHYYFKVIYVISTVLLLSSPALIKAQQPCIRNSITPCDVSDNSTTNLGYIFNGITPTCQAYLTFRSQPPLYNSISTISNLLSADPSQLAQLNSVSEDETFVQDKMVLVPSGSATAVNCSRSTSGQYYQASISYVVRPNDGFFVIANNTLEGLSTCQAIQAQNSVSSNELDVGMRIEVPLRCSCPTKSQSDAGIKYLLSYLVTFGESVDSISDRIGVETSRILEANGLLTEDTIYPFTTLLIPLQNPPTSSQVKEPATPPPPPPISPLTPPGKSSSKAWIYVVAGVIGGLVLLLIIGAIIFCVFFRKSKKKIDPVIVSDSYKAREKSTDKKLEVEYSDFFDSVSSIAESLKVYKFEELQSATQNFSPSCWIKGSVYRGTFNGDLAAIKKINGDVSKEISILNKINHFNLIRLSGVCFNNGDWYLVYEYAVNGPLTEWIINNNNQKLLTWTQRIQIALDVATGLNYLHSYAFPPYVHKDIKSDTILLDGDYRAKIFNFDLARSADGEGGQFVLTRHIVGTKGHMAPEYLENGMISTKLDVYSFGILMLEMLTGKEVASLYEVETDLSDVLGPILNEGNGKDNLSNFIDLSLQGNYPADIALFMVRLIVNCIKTDPSGRPDMNEIVHSLLRILKTSFSWERSISISE